MGGFTTYSAFNQETLQYLQQGAWATAALYVAATLSSAWPRARWAWWRRELGAGEALALPTRRAG